MGKIEKNKIAKALNCGGHCDAYCYGCSNEEKAIIKRINDDIRNGYIGADIISAAEKVSLEKRKPL